MLENIINNLNKTAILTNFSKPDRWLETQDGDWLRFIYDAAEQLIALKDSVRGIVIDLTKEQVKAINNHFNIPEDCQIWWIFPDELAD